MFERNHTTTHPRAAWLGVALACTASLSYVLIGLRWLDVGGLQPSEQPAPIIYTAAALLTLWIGHRLLHVPLSLMIGMLAGLQTQPAALGFALERTNNDVPNVGYATVYPVAMIAKIIIVQVMLAAMMTG